MKQILFLILIIVCFATTARSQQSTSGTPSFQHVIVIGIDGMSSEGLMKAKTPFIDQLIEKGAFKYDARTVLPTVSSPNWSAMIHGAGPEITGISSNDWQPDSTFMKPVMANKSGRFPSIFNLIREQMPAAEQGTIFHWDGFGRLLQKDVVNRYEHVATPTESAQKFANYIQEKRPTFAFLQLDHVDGAGHHFGHMTEGYLQSISNADSLVAIIVDAIKQAGIGENTFLMIVSDHGGINKGHGGESVEEITVPVIYCGNGIKNGYKIQQQVYIYDVAANVAFALGLKIPYAWTGRPTKAAFTGFEEPENLNTGIQ